MVKCSAHGHWDEQKNVIGVLSDSALEKPLEKAATWGSVFNRLNCFIWDSSPRFESLPSRGGKGNDIY